MALENQTMAAVDNSQSLLTNVTQSVANAAEPVGTYSCLYTHTYNTIFSVVSSVLAVPTILGNTLIIISIFKFSQMFEGSLFLLLRNLAMAEWLLGVSLTLFPLEIAVPALKNNVQFCLMRSSLFATAFGVSCFTLVMISIDRFMAVLKPMKHLIISQKRTTFNRVLLMGWIVNLIASLVPVYMEHFVFNPSKTFHCRNALLVPRKSLIMPSCSLAFEFMFNIIMYAFVIRGLRQTDMHNKKALSTKVKTISMIIVFAAFGICWTPFIVTSFIQFSLSSQTDIERIICIAEYTVLPGSLNSSLNWIIYGLANRKFRKAFKSLLKCNQAHSLLGTLRDRELYD